MPGLFVTIFGIGGDHDPWIRVAGMLVLLLAFYYEMSVREGVTALFRWSVPARLSVPVFFLAFVLNGVAPPVILPFAAVDVAGPALTGRAPRAAARGTA